MGGMGRGKGRIGVDWCEGARTKVGWGWGYLGCRGWELGRAGVGVVCGMGARARCGWGRCCLWYERWG